MKILYAEMFLYCDAHTEAAFAPNCAAVPPALSFARTLGAAVNVAVSCCKYVLFTSAVQYNY